MNVRKKQATVILITAVYAVLALHTMTYWHEEQHVDIYHSYNCTDITVEYEYLDFDTVLATTSAYCSGGHSMPEHEELHEVQETLWIVYLFTVLIVELVVIKRVV